MLVILILIFNYTLLTLNIHNCFKNDNDRNRVIQRLTALWAFAESGLGGVLHALQVPFTGLIVGGIAMMIITLISTISTKMFKDLSNAFLIVVVVKLTISPYTPITAYFALLFQYVLGFLIYRVFTVNYLSILFFSCIAMLESAIQKILLLVLFYGNNLYKATNDFINFILQQFLLPKVDASLYILCLYILIYIVGGILISIVTIKIIQSPYHYKVLEMNDIEENVIQKKKKNKQPIIYLTLAVLLAICVYYLNTEKTTNFKILYSLVFSFLIIVFWYFILTPFFTKQVSKFLKTKEFKMKQDIETILHIIPTLQRLIKVAWKHTEDNKGFYRINAFALMVFSWIIFHHQQQQVIKGEC